MLPATRPSVAFQTAFTLVRVRVLSPSTGYDLSTGSQGLHNIVSSVTLRHVRRNNDVVIDVITFWRPFLLFSWQKEEFTHWRLVFQGHS